MTAFLYRLGHGAARNAKIVISIWVLVAAAVITLNVVIAPAPQKYPTLEGSDSETAQLLVMDAFPSSVLHSFPVYLHNDSISFASAEGQKEIDRIVGELLKSPDVLEVQTPEQDPSLLSNDSHTATISATYSELATGNAQVAKEIVARLHAAEENGTWVCPGGCVAEQVSRPSILLSEILGLIAALLVLLVVLRKLSAVVLPLATALVSVAVGTAIIGLIGRAVYIPDVAPTLGAMLALGCGIDYSLFLIMRQKYWLRNGYSPPESIARTLGTAGAGMVFAGSILVAALCGLLFTGISFLGLLGIAAAVVVTTAVVSSLTLLPALLAVVKNRVLTADDLAVAAAGEDAEDTSLWARIARYVTNRPWRFAVCSTAVLLILSAPLLTLQLNKPSDTVYSPGTAAYQAQALAREAYGPGSSAAALVVLQLYSPAEVQRTSNNEPVLPNISPLTNKPESIDPRIMDPRIVAIRKELAALPQVQAVSVPVVSPNGGVALITATPKGADVDPETIDLVRELRSRYLPEWTERDGISPHVGGSTATRIDLQEVIAARTPLFIFGVIALTFLLLLAAYRSLLIPLKAAVMNLLSIAAAYGIVVAVFQWGWGVTLLGLDGPVNIEAFVPMMMFAVLFGLSMDYEIFLLTAFQEHWQKSGNMKDAICRGLAETGQVVTAAAIIMISVFASFILNPNPIIKVFGVGLAAAVFIDATIVRTILVPAVMVLAQRGTWWLPGWLDRLLPRFSVEATPERLDELANAPRQSRAASALRSRPQLVVSAAIAVVLATSLVWFLPNMPTMSLTPVLFSSAAGAIIAIFATTRLAGSHSTSASFGLYALGVIVASVVVDAVSAVVPPIHAFDGDVYAWGVFVVALASFAIFRLSIAFPLALGAAMQAIAESTIEGVSPALTSVLLVTIAPALVAAVATWLLNKALHQFPGRHEPPDVINIDDDDVLADSRQPQ